MRLDRFIAEQLGCTRKIASKLIKAGEVAVDGAAACRPEQRIESTQTIRHLDTILETKGPLYLMMHKPVGVVCSDADANHPIVQDLIDEDTLRRAPAPLQLVGRLDVDTSGLLLLTTDGKWNQALRSPKKKVPKRYLVSLSAALSDTDKSLLENGILLRSEDKPTAPCQIEFLAEQNQVSRQQVYITLTEGRYHQVKRMFAAVGNHVLALHRDRIGPWTLDETLAPGQYRALSEDELDRFAL